MLPLFICLPLSYCLILVDALSPVAPKHHNNQFCISLCLFFRVFFSFKIDIYCIFISMFIGIFTFTVVLIGSSSVFYCLIERQLYDMNIWRTIWKSFERRSDVPQIDENMPMIWSRSMKQNEHIRLIFERFWNTQFADEWHSQKSMYNKIIESTVAAILYWNCERFYCDPNFYEEMQITLLHYIKNSFVDFSQAFEKQQQQEDSFGFCKLSTRPGRMESILSSYCYNVNV